MKEIEKDIDKLFRKSLSDYKITPDESSKEKFLVSGYEIFKANKKSFSRWKLLGILAFLLIGLTSIILNNLPNGETLINKKVDPLNAISDKDNSLDSYSTVPDKNEDAQKNYQSNVHPSTPLSSKIIETNEGIYGKVVTTANKTNHNTKTDIIHNINRDGKTNRSKDIGFISNLKPFSQVVESDLDKSNFYLSSKYQYTTLSSTNEKVEDSGKETLTDNRQLNMAYSLNYSPQYIFNIIENNKLVHNFGIDVHFKLFNNKYIIRTGIGASVSKGYYEFAIDYNEYLGSYQGLDSVTFAWDDNHYNLIPTYYKSEREVFDTATLTNNSKFYKRFTYLQLPLVLGYDFITKEKYSLGVRFGPTLSILLSSDKLSEDFDPGKNKVLQINQITPDRISTNWLIMAGFNLGIKTKQHVFFEIEPQFSYYFNSVYEKYDVSKPPFGLGCRIAIGIK